MRNSTSTVSAARMAFWAGEEPAPAPSFASAAEVGALGAGAYAASSGWPSFPPGIAADLPPPPGGVGSSQRNDARPPAAAGSSRDGGVHRRRPAGAAVDPRERGGVMPARREVRFSVGTGTVIRVLA